MSQNVKIVELESVVESLPIEHEQDLLLLIPLAARLEALERPKFAAHWQSEAKRLGMGGEQLTRLLHDRCSEGLWDLNHADGEMLAIAVLDAQDFALFARGPQGGLVMDSANPAAQALRRHFELWFDSAERVALDDEAVELIHQYVEVFPIPVPQQLLSVAYPVPYWANQLAPRRIRQVVEQPWPSRANGRLVGSEPEISVYAMRDLAVPLFFQGEYGLKRMNEEFVLPDGTRLVVTRQILSNWKMVVAVDAPVPVRSVRFGSEVGYANNPDQPSHWLIHVTPRTDKLEQDKLLKLPLVIQLVNGFALRILGDD